MSFCCDYSVYNNTFHEKTRVFFVRGQVINFVSHISG